MTAPRFWAKFSTNSLKGDGYVAIPTGAAGTAAVAVGTAEVARGAAAVADNASDEVAGTAGVAGGTGTGALGVRFLDSIVIITSLARVTNAWIDNTVNHIHH